MARLIPPPTSGGLVGPFERKVLEALISQLPDQYSVAPNFQLKPKGQDAMEYDFVVIAPHAIYVIEAKEWYGRLTGDDTEWLLNHTPKKPALWLTELKCKILKAELGGLGSYVYVAPLLVVPDGTQILLTGNWSNNVCSLAYTSGYLQSPDKLPKPDGDIRTYYSAIEATIQGKWGVRQRNKRRRVGSYEILETRHADVFTAEYLARQALLEDDPTTYRIRTFRLDRSLPDAAQEQQKAVIRRPTEAVAKIGPHPNLLRVLQFEFIEDDSEFFEVTEWSDFGTLHGYLANQERDQLTLRERLAIAEGVAAALEAVHAHGIVHRNVCPETILVGFDRRPRLTDFDRAYLHSKHTVFTSTEERLRNPAYVPPELSDATDYDFDTASDMYSFGVLLYKLLMDEVPFKNGKAAKAANGVAPIKPSEKRPELIALDTLIANLLRVDDFKARPSATETLAALREAWGMTTGLAAKSAAPAPPVPTSLEPGAFVDTSWRIDARLGAGGFSKVFKVYNLDHQKAYAMKVLHKAEDVDLLLHEFNHIANSLPSHPNIAKIVWMGRLGPPEYTPYLISEFVDGETLEPYCDGRKRLPWTDTKRIGLELLDALAVMHPDESELQRIRALMNSRDLTEAEVEQFYNAQTRAEAGIFHRDIKPANIMLEMPAHRPKLIDFNIAVQAAEATGQAGTPRYWAPDRGYPKWKPDADLFSLGLVLYELILHRHPYADDQPGNGDPYDPREICTEFRISDELADFLLKAVQSSGVDRFQSAHEMKDALARINSMVAPALLPIAHEGRFPGLNVTAEEARRKNYNPYVTRLLKAYSQARHSNAGTRGLDEIARLTYVKTRLDEKLAPAIVSGLFRLVIVTGNAGDGKTAFLQQVEALFDENKVTVVTLESQNGSHWTHEGLHYETNYDGSQDEGNRDNDVVLERFFEPFAGDFLGGLDGTEVRLIAINEGRLLDFLSHPAYSHGFGGLRRFVLDALEGKAGQSRALLVNLNLRAVTAGGTSSLVERQLVAMLDQKLWAPCEGCTHQRRCPIKYNVDTLRDDASGAATRERVRRLFELVHLRRQAHVTMRDLRSALSYLLLRDQSCDDVATLLTRTDEQVTEELARLYYPDAFADHDAEIGRSATGALAHGRASGEERAVDRLVRRLREADVGLPNSPALDRRLDHDPQKAVPWMTFEGRSPMAWEVMQALTRDTPSPADDVSFEDLLMARRRLIAKWRRWAYFERRDEGWRTMLPYRSTALLERLVTPKSETDLAEASNALRDKVVDAISRAEGVQNDDLCRQYLALRITRVKDSPVRSYRVFPKESFQVQVKHAPGIAEYLEYAPDAVELVAEGGAGAARLRISLDLLEMLELIRNGYRPTTAELQGLFVNLLIFRNELLTTTFDRVQVTADDHDFYEIRAEGRTQGIRLTLAKHARSEDPPGKERPL